MLQNLLATVLILLALLCASTRAQQQTGPSENTDETTSGTITGQVVNERGEPMAGASVFVRPIANPAAGRTISTDAEGRFRITRLEAGLYMLTGHSPAYVFMPAESDSATPYYRIGDSARLEIMKGGVITGTVVNATGEPLIGVRIRALQIRDAKGQAARTAQYGMMERTTDDRGIYRLYGLSPGTYVVSAGGGPGNQSSQLNPYEGDVPTYAPSSTRDGATEFTVRSGEETTVDIRYRNDPGHTISGSVKVNGNNGAALVLTPVDAGFMPAANAFQPPGARGFEISGVGDGDYHLVAIEYPTNAQFTGTVPDVSMSETKRITVKGADVSGIELITKPSASLSGRIALEPSKAPECQGKRKPLFAETLIALQRPEKEAETTPGFVRSMGGAALSPDPKGAFVFRNLTPGRYRLNTTFYARFWYLQSISVGSAPTTTTAAGAKTAAPPRIDPAAGWTIVKPGEQISNVTITLAEGAASIRGRVPVAEGAAIPTGTAVYLIPAEADKATDVLRYFVTTVASDGTFALNSLPPGRYWSMLQNPVQTEIATLLKLRSPEAAEARAKLRRAAESQRESQKSAVELKPCQTITDYELSPK